MKPAMLALLFVPVVCVQGCARATAANATPKPIIVRAANDIAVRPGPRLTSLPLDQRYRFVPPDSLTIDLADADLESFHLPFIERRRTSLAAVLARGRWVESEDSAQFDVTIFQTSRTSLDASPPTQVAPNLGNCAAAPVGYPQCTDTPAQYTASPQRASWNTESTTLYIIRRRADGAVRVWHQGWAKAEEELLALLQRP